MIINLLFMRKLFLFMFKYTYNLKKCKSGLNPCVFFLNFIVIICNINPYKFLNTVEDGNKRNKMV